MRRSTPIRARLLASIVLFWGVVGAAVAAAPGDATSREYDIKAAFIYNFTKFIEWPPQSFGDMNAPFVIGVLGDCPCKPALEQLVKDRKVNGRAIFVRKVDTTQELGGAHLLFVGAEQESRFEQLQAAIAALPIVTVGESPRFASAGGAINFVLEGDKVRFEINMKSADRAGVKFSAQLMKLAITVRRS